MRNMMTLVANAMIAGSAIAAPQAVRRIVNALPLFAALLAMLPNFAEAGLYKCVDEKTKAVTYSGTPCYSGTVSEMAITENAVMDHRTLKDEVGRQKASSPSVSQSSQQSRSCESSAIASHEANQAEDELRAAKNSSHRTGNRAVRDAQANLDFARDRRDNPCDPGVAQRGAERRAQTEAADAARRQQAFDSIKMQSLHDKVDAVQRKLDFGF